MCKNIYLTPIPTTNGERKKVHTPKKLNKKLKKIRQKTQNEKKFIYIFFFYLQDFVQSARKCFRQEKNEENIRDFIKINQVNTYIEYSFSKIKK